MPRRRRVSVKRFEDLIRAAPSRRASTRLAVLILAPLVCLEVYVAGCRQVGVPAVAAWPRRFATPIVAGDLWVGEVFTVKASGFDRVMIRAVPAGPTPAGEVVFKLRDMSDGSTGTLFREGRYPVERILADDSFWFDFTPIEESHGRRYRVEVSMPEADERGAIRLLATRQKRTADSRLFIGDEPYWADLLFRTGATRASVGDRLVSQLKRIDSVTVWMAIVILLVAAHIAFAIVAVTILGSSRSTE